MPERIYLDHAASTPVRPEVREATRPYLGDAFANPSSGRAFGRAAQAGLETARQEVAVFGRKALALPAALARGVEAFRAGERRAGSVIAAAWKVLGAEDGVTTDYINVLDAETFQPSHAATASSYLAAAVRVGPTRLIDNVILGEGLEADRRVSDRSSHGRAAAR